MQKILKASVVALAVMLMAVALAACGSSDDSSSSSDTSSSEGDTTASKDAKLGEEAAASPKVALPQVKAGILNLGRVSESGGRAEDVAIEALDAIGWSHVSCDSQGDPAAMGRCGETLLNQGVEALYLVAIPPEAIQPTLKRAQSEGIPVLSFAGGNPPSPLMAAQYGAEEEREGELLGEYLVERLEEEGNEDELQVALFSSFIFFAKAREEGFNKAIAVNPNIKIVEEKEVDPTNSVGSTEQATAAILNQFPDLGAIVTTWDDAIAGAARSVQKKYPNAQYPDRPLLLSFDAVKTNQPWIARGVVDAVIDADYASVAWAMVDQTAGFVSRETAVSKEIPEYPGITLVEPQLITEENLPPEGEYVPPPFDPEAFFTAKWQTEFK